jgi:copper(I)-binding protein
LRSDSPRVDDLRVGDMGADSLHSDAMHADDSASGATASGDAVAIMNAWVREAHPDATTHAGYMTLVNVSSEEKVLVRLESPTYDKVELHQMTMADGMMKMRALAEMVIPAGGQARLEPGGTHLMLWDPKQPLTKGESVDLTLIFRSGRQQTVSVKVDDL